MCRSVFIHCIIYFHLLSIANHLMTGLLIPYPGARYGKETEIHIPPLQFLCISLLNFYCLWTSPWKRATPPFPFPLSFSEAAPTAFNLFHRVNRLSVKGGERCERPQVVCDLRSTCGPTDPLTCSPGAPGVEQLIHPTETLHFISWMAAVKWHNCSAIWLTSSPHRTWQFH